MKGKFRKKRQEMKIPKYYTRLPEVIVWERARNT